MGMRACCQSVALVGDYHEIERHRVWHMAGEPRPQPHGVTVVIEAARREGYLRGLEKAEEIARAHDVAATPRTSRELAYKIADAIRAAREEG